METPKFLKESVCDQMKKNYDEAMAACYDRTPIKVMGDREKENLADMVSAMTDEEIQIVLGNIPAEKIFRHLETEFSHLASFRASIESIAKIK